MKRSPATESQKLTFVYVFISFCMIEKFENMEKITCRACLNESFNSNDYNSLFTSINVEQLDKPIKLCQMLLDCTSVLCQEYDGLPNVLCKICSKEIHNAYIFREKCLKSQRILSEIKKNNVEMKTENEFNKCNDIPFIKCDPISIVSSNINDSDVLTDYDIEFNDVSINHILDDNPNSESNEESESDLTILQLATIMKKQKSKNSCNDDNLRPKCEVCGKTYKNYQSLRVRLNSK